MSKAVTNIREDPSFFLQNSARSFHLYLKALDVSKGVFHNLLYILTTLFMFTLFLFNITRTENRKEMFLLTCLLIGACIAQRLIPGDLNSLIVLAGMVFAVVAANRKSSLLLATSLIFSGLSIAIVGGLIKERTFLLIGWVFLLFYFFAVYFAFQYFSSKILGRNAPVRCNRSKETAISSDEGSFGFEPHARAILRLSAALILTFFLLGGLRLAYLNFLKTPPNLMQTPALTMEQKKEILAILIARLPAAFTEGKDRAEDAFFRPLDFGPDQDNHGKIFAEKGNIGLYLYRVSGRARIDHWSRLFYPRPYERSIFELENGAYFLFPGRIPPDLRKRDLVFVGRVNVDTRFFYEGRILVEGIALIPYDSETDRIELEKTVTADNKIHQMFLEYNKPVL
jgi:hypothetical protein